MTKIPEGYDLANLLVRLRANQELAQREFWDLYSGELFRFCEGMLGVGLVANEMAVEVLTEFLTRYVHGIDRPEAIRAYLRMMAIRRCARERKRREAPVYADMDSFSDDASKNTEDAGELRVLLSRLEVCLQDLTPKAQRVLMLRYFGGMANEKIGRLLGGSKQYIGRLITKSHEKLRACLEEKKWNPPPSGASSRGSRP